MYSTGWSLYIIREWWGQGKRLHGKHRCMRIFNFSWILSAGWATEVWYLGKKIKRSERSRHFQFTRYTFNSDYIEIRLQNQIKIILESHLHWWARGFILVLWHCACASSLIQLSMLNKQEKVGKNNHPWVNMRQYKGFDMQLTNVVLFFAGNRVAAYLSVLNSSKIPLKEKSTHDNKLRITGISIHRLCFYSLHLDSLIQQEIEPFIFFTYIFSMSCFSSKAVGRSRLLPRTKT